MARSPATANPGADERLNVEYGYTIPQGGVFGIQGVVANNGVGGGAPSGKGPLIGPVTKTGLGPFPEG